MFDNIGGKIKGLAKFVCWAGIIFSAIYAIVLWSHNDRYNNTILLGFAVLIGGGITSWIGSFFVYGFGELIEHAASIDYKLQSGHLGSSAPVAVVTKTEENGTTKTVTTIKSASELSRDEKIIADGGWKCPKCGKANYSYSVTCTNCSAKRYESLTNASGKI